MPTYDLKRAYIDHIKSLDPAQRRQFGANLRAAINGHISERQALIPSVMRNGVPFTPEQLFGPRILLLGQLADKLAAGAYSGDEIAQMDPVEFGELLENDLDETFEDITDRDHAEENKDFNELLKRAKDPQAYRTNAEQPTPREYRVNQADPDREYFFDRHSDMEDLFSDRDPDADEAGDDGEEAEEDREGRKRLTEAEVSARREKDREKRDAYAARIEKMLNDALANAVTSDDTVPVRERIVRGFTHTVYNVGLGLRTGEDLHEAVKSELTAAINKADDDDEIKKDVLAGEIKKAAKKIADADLYMFYADKLEGISRYIQTGDPASLDKETYPVIENEILEGLDKRHHDDARMSDIGLDRVLLYRTKEEIADALFQEYLRYSENQEERIRFLASCGNLIGNSLIKPNFREAIELFGKKAVRHEISTDGHSDPRKTVAFLNSLASFMTKYTIEAGSAENVDETLNDGLYRKEGIAGMQFNIIHPVLDRPLQEHHLGLYRDLLNTLQAVQMNDPSVDQDEKEAYYRARNQVELEDPVERYKARLFDQFTKSGNMIHGDLVIAKDVLSAFGPEALYNAADLALLENTVKTLELADKDKQPRQENPLYTEFKNSVNKFATALRKFVNDPLMMTSREISELSELNTAAINATSAFLKDTQAQGAVNGGIAPLHAGSPQICCAQAVLQTLREDYADLNYSAGSVRTAARWIEDAQAHLSASPAAAPDAAQVAMILAARQLADSVPGSRRRLDETVLTARELIARANEITAEPAFVSFMEKHGNDPALRAALLDGHGGGIEPMFRDHLTTVPHGQLPNSPLLARYMPTAGQRINAVREELASSLLPLYRQRQAEYREALRTAEQRRTAADQAGTAADEARTRLTDLQNHLNALNERIAVHRQNTATYSDDLQAAESALAEAKENGIAELGQLQANVTQAQARLTQNVQQLRQDQLAAAELQAHVDAAAQVLQAREEEAAQADSTAFQTEAIAAEQAAVISDQEKEIAAAAAEILQLRRLVHADEGAKKPLDKTIPLNGKLQDGIRELADNEEFRNLLKEDGVLDLAASGDGSRLEAKLLSAYKGNGIGFLDSATVNGRISEICRKDAAGLKERLSQALDLRDTKAAEEVRKDYIGMLSELIVLDELAHSGNGQKKITWADVDKKIADVRKNPAYRAITADLSNETLLSDLDRLNRNGTALDADKVPVALEILGNSHKPWRSASKRLKDEQRRILAKADFYKTEAGLQQKAEKIAAFTTSYMNEAIDAGKRPSAKEVRQQATKRYEHFKDMKIAKASAFNIAKMLAAYQLTNGDMNQPLHDSDLTEMANGILGDPVMSDFLNSYKDNPKALRDLALKGDGSELCKAVHDYLLKRPACELTNTENLKMFMPTYAERIEELQKQAAAAEKAAGVVENAKNKQWDKMEAAIKKYCEARDIECDEEADMNNAANFIYNAGQSAERELKRIQDAGEAAQVAAALDAAVNGTDEKKTAAKKLVNQYCFKRSIRHSTEEERANAISRIRQDAQSFAQKSNLTRDEKDALKVKRAIDAYNEAKNAGDNAKKNLKRVHRNVAAEIVTLRNLAHAGRKEKSRLEQKIRAEGVLELHYDASGLSRNRHFQDLITDETIKKMQKGHGGEMYQQLNEEHLAQAGNIHNDDMTYQVENVGKLFRVNTVGGRLDEIQHTEAGALYDRLDNAVINGNQKEIDRAVEDYRKLLAEVIALNGAKQNSGAESKIDWKSINGSIDRRDQNALFAGMTRDLEPAAVMNELQSLRNDTLNQFLTHQADRLNQLNNQQAQQQAPQAKADGLDYQPDVIKLNGPEEKNEPNAPQEIERDDEEIEFFI